MFSLVGRSMTTSASTFAGAADDMRREVGARATRCETSGNAAPPSTPRRVEEARVAGCLAADAGRRAGRERAIMEEARGSMALGAKAAAAGSVQATVRSRTAARMAEDTELCSGSEAADASGIRAQVWLAGRTLCLLQTVPKNHEQAHEPRPPCESRRGLLCRI